MSILNLVRPDLVGSIAYDIGSDEIPYRMHANELPWSPLEFEKVSLNFYPGVTQENELCSLLASRYEAQTNQLMLTRGSDEALDLLIRLFIQPTKDSILQCPPTFSMYAFFARLQQAEVISCPLNVVDFSWDESALLQSWNPSCKIVVLCTPNNPTGNSISLAKVSSLCKALHNKAIVIVDEAYIEFSSNLSAVCLINSVENLVVLRTLSKAYGLAGLRLGCMIAQEDTINLLRGIRAPYALSEVVLNIAQKALLQPSWFVNAISMVVSERERLFYELSQLSYIEKVYPSDANFLLVRTPESQPLIKYLLSRGIAVRGFNAPSLHHCVRITVGNAQQNQYLLDTLRTYSVRN
jgi:histidinol-phosphate aminotransferase